ncbi:hypothetical protein GTO91_02670 [Heliobacterium undosum]|uniref:Uncharacterized protein n=1 Tax=Heliomicrobium undosum TaxID=121734 RepID=A0A845KY14_9FIRM|nr:hypothetical protein [Heliomicrobium undosum]MZP28622.1 hypothetical protein [Heliomicrobium undosum]
MKIPYCERCGATDTQGAVCGHCDTMYCYDCMEKKQINMFVCKKCGRFICAACRTGMDDCGQVPVGQER